jgi:hypothetical protein
LFSFNFVYVIRPKMGLPINPRLFSLALKKLAFVGLFVGKSGTAPTFVPEHPVVVATPLAF